MRVRDEAAPSRATTHLYFRRRLLNTFESGKMNVLINLRLTFGARRNDCRGRATKRLVFSRAESLSTRLSSSTFGTRFQDAPKVLAMQMHVPLRLRADRRRSFGAPSAQKSRNSRENERFQGCALLTRASKLGSVQNGFPIRYRDVCGTRFRFAARAPAFSVGTRRPATAIASPMPPPTPRMTVQSLSCFRV
jgi:hypothetical protein